MQLFYIPEIDGNSAVLSEEESRHCARVLRLREGDVINLTNGKGRISTGRLVTVDQRECRAGIVDTRLVPANPWHLHVAIAPTKNMERFEWFLEKATEIGIGEITPLFCEHSERITLKMQRLEKILVSAMKQSLKAWLPVLNEPAGFGGFISRRFSGQKFFGYCDQDNENELHSFYRRGSDVVILIGPEGDFSKTEADLAMKEGFTPVRMGKSRLRTETAGVVAVHTIGMMNSW